MRSEPETDKNSQRDGQRKKPPDGWGPIFRGALAELSSHSWLQNFVIGFALLLVWPLIGATIMKSYRATIIGFGIGATFLIWIGVWVLYRQASVGEEKIPESELHGVLTPANDPSPPNPCNDVPPNTTFIFMGNSAAPARQFPFIVIQIAGEDLITVDKTGEGIFISTVIRSEDGKVIAKIEKNEFRINPNNYFYQERPDRHTLIVHDEHDRIVLGVRFLNPLTIQFTHLLLHSIDSAPVLIENGDLRVVGIARWTRGCFQGGIGAIRIRP